MGERADICRQIITDEKIVTDIKSDVAKWQARRAVAEAKGCRRLRVPILRLAAGVG
jgi:hypothetical protein